MLPASVDYPPSIMELAPNAACSPHVAILAPLKTLALHPVLPVVETVRDEPKCTRPHVCMRARACVRVCVCVCVCVCVPTQGVPQLRRQTQGRACLVRGRHAAGLQGDLAAQPTQAF